uniref:Neur_chan_LBD domain-containing protein n=1 Tax=Meloidogyne hapla TaxID=6305 RepID=A0A1I8BC27_MELHA
MVDTINGINILFKILKLFFHLGTFFRLLTQLELIDTREFGNSPNYLGLEFSLFVHFRDDRLQFRDLNDLPISLADEFTPWQPRIQILPLLTTQTIQTQKNIHLNPKSGLITFVYRFSGQLYCNSDIWKEPFEKYSCQFWFETEIG